MQQVFVLILKSNRVAWLLQRPDRIWMCGDVTMDLAPTAVLNHHDHIQQSKRRGDDDEEIAHYDPLGVQALEGRPAQVTSRSAPRMPGQILAHGPRRNLNIQLHEQLVGKTFLTPRRILV